MIRTALASGGVSPDQVDYIEAHGTGTALGDPIEMHALAAVFGGRTRELLVGSVKTNIGHTEATAGIAGFIKAVMMLRRQAVPASLHFRALNPHIDLGGVPIVVPTALVPRSVEYVGVSSFGFSGTNTHVVLSRGPSRADSDNPDPASDVHRLFVSARTPEALRVLIGRYRALLDRGVPFADLCHSAAVGRARLPWWICVDDPGALDTAEPSAGPAPALPPQRGRLVDLPLYPFQRQPYWVPPPRATTPPAPAGTHPLLGRRIRSGLAHIQHEARLAPDQPNWLADHAVNGRVIVPAAALAEMLLAAAPSDGPVALTTIVFRQMLAPAEQPWVQTVADPASRTLTIFAAADAETAEFSEIATASWAVAEAAPEESIEATRVGATRPFDLPTLYDRFAAAGLFYGPAFRCLRRLTGGDRLAIAELADSDPTFRLDPRVLDAAWQKSRRRLAAGQRLGPGADRAGSPGLVRRHAPHIDSAFDRSRPRRRHAG